MGGQCRHCAEPAHPLLYIHTVDSRTIPISRGSYDGLLPDSLYAADYFLWLCADLILPSRWQLAAYCRTTQTFLSLGNGIEPKHSYKEGCWLWQDTNCFKWPCISITATHQLIWSSWQSPFGNQPKNFALNCVELPSPMPNFANKVEMN